MTLLIPPDPNHNLLPYDGIVNDFGEILNNDESGQLYSQLLNQLPWQSDKVTLFGKTHITTRKIVWIGDTTNNNDLAYTYSGHTRPILPWHPTVLNLKHLIEQHLQQININANFNTCLLNHYPQGMDGMGYHADDEPELGYQPIIASLSLGATRKFVLKHKRTQHKIECPLHAGQLIIMRGDTQTHWKHTITKTKKISIGRISLTFRQM